VLQFYVVYPLELRNNLYTNLHFTYRLPLFFFILDISVNSDFIPFPVLCETNLHILHLLFLKHLAFKYKGNGIKFHRANCLSIAG